MMTNKIYWHTEQRRIGELIEWEKNPRQLSEHDAEHLKKSLDGFGIADPFIINTDNYIIGGHMRRRVLLKNGYRPEDKVDVRVPSRTLSDREVEELAIRLNKNTGSWDFDALANGFDQEDLLNWGFQKFQLGIVEGSLDYDEEMQGMPEFEQEYAGPVQTIKVHFLRKEDIRKFEALIGQTITDKTKSIWYPKQEFDQTGTKEGLVYTDESTIPDLHHLEGSMGEPVDIESA